MGLAASQARLLMLTARKSDLELQLQFIQQARQQLANMVSSLFQPTSNLDARPDNPQVQQKQNAIVAIQMHDKNYEMQAQRVTTQHDAVQTEMEAVQKVIQKNIETSFKLMG